MAGAVKLRFSCNACGAELLDESTVFTSCGHFFCATTCAPYPVGKSGICSICEQESTSGLLTGKGMSYNSHVRTFVFDDPIAEMKKALDMIKFVELHRKIFENVMRAKSIEAARTEEAYKRSTVLCSQLEKELQAAKQQIVTMRRQIQDLATENQELQTRAVHPNYARRRAESAIRTRDAQASMLNEWSEVPRARSMAIAGIDVDQIPSHLRDHDIADGVANPATNSKILKATQGTTPSHGWSRYAQQREPVRLPGESWRRLCKDLPSEADGSGAHASHPNRIDPRTISNASRSPTSSQRLFLRPSSTHSRPADDGIARFRAGNQESPFRFPNTGASAGTAFGNEGRSKLPSASPSPGPSSRYHQNPAGPGNEAGYSRTENRFRSSICENPAAAGTSYIAGYHDRLPPAYRNTSNGPEYRTSAGKNHSLVNLHAPDYQQNPPYHGGGSAATNPPRSLSGRVDAGMSGRVTMGPTVARSFGSASTSYTTIPAEGCEEQRPFHVADDMGGLHVPRSKRLRYSSRGQDSN